MTDTPTPERDFDPILLDLHLGHLSTVEQADVRKRIAAEPELAEQDAALAAMFAALNAPQAAPMPPDLVARTVARVQAAGPAPRVVRPRDELTAHVERQDVGIIRLGNLRDIVAVAALIVLAVGIGVPGLLHMRERSQRLGCSYNLAQLGVGLQQYASTYASSVPFAGFGRMASWQPTDDPAMVTVPNRRHVYPLLRLHFVQDPRLFICPSQPHVPMPADLVQRYYDFLEGRNISYAYQNMAGARPSANDDARLPILSDENPLFEDGLPLLDARRFQRPELANSRAHDGGGQNILTLGGHVRWATTPLAGIDDDNIWVLQDVESYTGREGPSSTGDAHLLK